MASIVGKMVKRSARICNVGNSCAHGRIFLIRLRWHFLLRLVLHRQAQFAHVRATGVLEYAQAELRKDRQQVIEDIRLDGLVA
ncbi:hypothetical protein D3C72_2207180 [compost metagenome]